MFTRRVFVNVCALVGIALAGAPPSGAQRQGGPPADVSISGELRQWHKVTLTLTGPQADELSNAPNPFMDYRMMVTFTHESGSPTYSVPGYFAGDGDAANSSATSGNKWRAHLAPDKTGRWTYRISFVSGKGVALATAPAGQAVAPFDGRTGTFQIAATDKHGARLSGARPVAVRGQTLSAVCRQRGVLPETRERLTRDAAGVCRLRRHGRAQAASAASHLHTACTGLEAGRSDLEGRQRQGTHWRGQLPGVQRRELDLVSSIQRRR